MYDFSRVRLAKKVLHEDEKDRKSGCTTFFYALSTGKAQAVAKINTESITFVTRVKCLYDNEIIAFWGSKITVILLFYILIVIIIHIKHSRALGALFVSTKFH